MKKIVTLTAAALLVSASMAFAQGGLLLHYNGCSLDGGGQSATFACDNNLGSEVMFASVIVPAPMPLFLGTSAIIDVLVDAPALPDWWLTASGQCRANAVSMSFDPTVLSSSSCGNVWMDQPNLSVFAVQQYLHGPNTVRFNGGAAVPAGQEISLPYDGTTELNVCRLAINHSKSTGTGSCAGCNVGACIVLQECYMEQPTGNPLYRLTTPIANVVTFQNGSLACTGATPAKNRTWGAVKGLYR